MSEIKPNPEPRSPKYDNLYEATLHEVDGGHMAYHRFIAVRNNEPDLFIKAHNPHTFTDPVREAHSRQYLHKENKLYSHLRQYNFKAIPNSVKLHDGHTLMMEALDGVTGWTWRAPNDLNTYIQSALKHLDTLQSMPIPDEFHDTILPTYDTHIHEGWVELNDNLLEQFNRKITNWSPKLRPEFQTIVPEIIRDLPTLKQEFDNINHADEKYLCHHDFRQANIAWHPEHGTRIVDWSWAGVGRKNSDATTLLIDLHKSGHDVGSYMHKYNPDHALTLIGFWVAHSLWPTRNDDNSVRFHQAVSALSAYDLLAKFSSKHNG